MRSFPVRRARILLRSVAASLPLPRVRPRAFDGGWAQENGYAHADFTSTTLRLSIPLSSTTWCCLRFMFPSRAPQVWPLHPPRARLWPDAPGSSLPRATPAG
jgi:hypothetical protein